MSLKLVCALLVFVCVYYACEARHVISPLTSEKVEDIFDDDFGKMQKDEQPSHHLTQSDFWHDHHHGEKDTMAQRKKAKHVDYDSDESAFEGEQYGHRPRMASPRGTGGLPRGNADGEYLLKQQELFNRYISTTTTQRNEFRRSDLIDYMGSRSSHGGHDEDDEGKRNNIAKLTY